VATGIEEMVKVAVLALAATVTLAGTVAADVSLLLRVTSAPPTGAGPLSVTVPVEDTPPTTDVGVAVILVKVAALIVNPAVCVVPL
jgi:hypothetical protein